MAVDTFVIGGKEFQSRLIVGSGKYKDFAETREATIASGAEMITVAVRRVNISDPTKESLLEYLSDIPSLTILPNTAGCYTLEDCLRTARLAREAGVGNFVVLCLERVVESLRFDLADFGLHPRGDVLEVLLDDRRDARIVTG